MKFTKMILGTAALIKSALMRTTASLENDETDQGVPTAKKQGGLDAFRAGEGRLEYNEYKKRQYAAKIEITKERAVRSYGVPDNDEEKIARRREQKRVAAATYRAKTKL